MSRKTFFVASYLYSLVSTLYLFLFGWLTRSNRALIYQMSSHFGLKTYQDNPTLQVLSPKKVIGELERVEVHEPIGVDGNVSTSELLIISALVKKYQCQNIFEIGTFDGRTTLNMAANAPKDAKIFTLDLPQEEMGSAQLEITNGDEAYIKKEASGLRFVDTPHSYNIKQLYGDSAKFDFSPYHGKIDCIFIDGSHSYSYVVSDTENALKICPNGIMIWHDYNMSCRGVIRALNEFQISEPKLKNIAHIEGTSLVVYIPEKRDGLGQEMAS